MADQADDLMSKIDAALGGDGDANARLQAALREVISAFDCAVGLAVPLRYAGAPLLSCLNRLPPRHSERSEESRFTLQQIVAGGCDPTDDRTHTLIYRPAQPIGLPIDYGLQPQPIAWRQGAFRTARPLRRSARCAARSTPILLTECKRDKSRRSA